MKHELGSLNTDKITNGLITTSGAINQLKEKKKEGALFKVDV